MITGSAFLTPVALTRPVAKFSTLAASCAYVMKLYSPSTSFSNVLLGSAASGTCSVCACACARASGDTQCARSARVCASSCDARRASAACLRACSTQAVRPKAARATRQGCAARCAARREQHADAARAHYALSHLDESARADRRPAAVLLHGVHEGAVHGVAAREGRGGQLASANGGIGPDGARRVGAHAVRPRLPGVRLRARCASGAALCARVRPARATVCAQRHCALEPRRSREGEQSHAPADRRGSPCCSKPRRGS